MKHPYSNVLPEIEESWGEVFIAGFIKDNISIRLLKQDEQEQLLDFLYFKMACMFGGYQTLWKTDEEEAFIKAGYRNVFQNLTTQALFAGLYELISGRTEYKSYRPNALEFLDICKNAPKWPEPEKEKLLELEQNSVPKEKVKELMGNVIKMLKKV